jgi:hypothetical protein
VLVPSGVVASSEQAKKLTTVEATYDMGELDE